MGSLAIFFLLSVCILSCDSGVQRDHDEFKFGTSGGSGDTVSFSYDCDSHDVDCPGALKVRDPLPLNGHQVKCAWSCALNTTEYKDIGFEDLTEPARHVVTLRKMGDKCWRVHDVDTDKCGKDLNENEPLNL